MVSIMIAMIEGQVRHLTQGVATIMTASGVGYEVELPLPTFYTLTINQQVSLWTTLVVREDAQILCGFANQSDQQAFKTLIKISGIGVRMALAMLSTMSADKLALCVKQGDELALTRIPGVGKKTAQRLLIELQGKLHHQPDDVIASISINNEQSDNYIINEVQTALISLGYKEKEATQAIGLAKANIEQMNTQNLLRAALKCLSAH